MDHNNSKHNSSNSHKAWWVVVVWEGLEDPPQDPEVFLRKTCGWATNTVQCRAIPHPR